MSSHKSGDIRDLPSKIKSAVSEAVVESADVLADIVRRNIKSGYDETPMGSDPWEPIGDKHKKDIGGESHSGLVVTGALLNSVGSRRISSTQAEVSVDSEYAIRHEYGHKMPMRPFFRPAVFEFSELGMAKDIIDKKIREVVK